MDQNIKIICNSHSHQRLDKYLSVQLHDISRSRIQNWLAEGHVWVNDAVVFSPNYKIKTGDCITISPPAPSDPIPQGENIPLHIIFEDEHIIVINKSPGLVVHPAPGHYEGTLVNALIHHCGESLSGIGDVKRPGIVHRLDKETSGLMVAAKNDQAHQILSAQFHPGDEESKMLQREYVALVWGRPTPHKGTISAPIGRHRINRQKMAVVQGSNGKPAITHYETLKTWRFSDKIDLSASLVRCILETGRTHQIRVHMEKIGHPLVGDPLYGKKSVSKLYPQFLRDFSRQALHAQRLRLTHPVTLTPMTFECPPAQDFQDLLDNLEPYRQ
jgi:23S rRNA pseudouridine1911/1915/1917 synthase